MAKVIICKNGGWSTSNEAEYREMLTTHPLLIAAVEGFKPNEVNDVGWTIRDYTAGNICKFLELARSLTGNPGIRLFGTELTVVDVDGSWEILDGEQLITVEDRDYIWFKADSRGRLVRVSDKPILGGLRIPKDIDVCYILGEIYDDWFQ